MKVVNNLFWMDEPRPEWHDPELQPRVDEEEATEPSGRPVTPAFMSFGRGRHRNPRATTARRIA